MSHQQESQPQQELQKSEFDLCLQEIFKIIDPNEKNSETLIAKLDELAAIHQKRINGFKSIIQGQKEFHNANNKVVKQETKERNALIRQLQEDVQNLKDAITVYKGLELKYAEATRQLKEKK